MLLTVLGIIEKAADLIFTVVSVAYIVLLIVKRSRAWALQRKKLFTGIAAAFLLLAVAARIAVFTTV